MDPLIQQVLRELLEWAGAASLGLTGLGLNSVEVRGRTRASFTVEQLTRFGRLILQFEDPVSPAIPVVLAKMVEERLEYHELSFLIASAVHDCKNPLSVASGYLELLSWQEPGNEYIAHIETQLTSLNDRLEEILAGVSAYPVGHVDAHRVASQLVEELAPYYARRGIELTVQGRPTWVRADHRRLRRVLNNLVENAEEALKSQGRIWVTVEPQGEWAEIAVHDTGPGVDRSAEEALFTAYYTSKPTGHGLGLLFSRRMIEALGGTLTYQRSTMGATFVVRLVADLSGAAQGPQEVG